MWGEFSQRAERLSTEFVSDPLHFYKLLNSAEIEMHDLWILNDDIVALVFKRIMVVSPSQFANAFYPLKYTVLHYYVL